MEDSGLLISMITMEEPGIGIYVQVIAVTVILLTEVHLIQIMVCFSQPTMKIHLLHTTDGMIFPTLEIIKLKIFKLMDLAEELQH